MNRLSHQKKGTGSATKKREQDQPPKKRKVPNQKKMNEFSLGKIADLKPEAELVEAKGLSHL
jgi:hypothetical protein